MYRHGSCRAERFAKGTSEDLDRDWPWHDGEKNHGRVRRKAFVLKQKAHLCARVDSISSYGGGKAGEVPLQFEKKTKINPTTRNPLKFKQQQQNPKQSTFAKLSGTC